MFAYFAIIAGFCKISLNFVVLAYIAKFFFQIFHFGPISLI